MVATLRIEFAQTITMGVTIGAMIQRALEDYAQPILQLFIPTAYLHWIPVITIYGTVLHFCFHSVESM